MTELDAFIIMDKLGKRLSGRRLSSIIRCKCLDSLERLKSQYSKSGIPDDRIRKKILETYKYCINIFDLLPPYYGCFSRRLIKAFFKRL